MTSSKSEYTTISLPGDTKRRLEEARPFDSMSWDEFLAEMADVYENER